MDLVVDSLASATQEFDLERIIVWDDIFTLNHSRLADFRRKLKERALDLRFVVNAHTSFFTERTAEEFAKIGVEEAWFGIESASDRLLRFLNKKAGAKDAFRASRLCREYNIPFCIYLMVGLPTQTKEDYEITLDFLREAKPDKAVISYFTPYPGSMFFDYCIRHGYMPEDWSFEGYLQADAPITPSGEKIYSGLRKIDYNLADDYKSRMEEIVAMNRKRKTRITPLVSHLKVSQEEALHAVRNRKSRSDFSRL